jgi:hypothetical protein
MGKLGVLLVTSAAVVAAPNLDGGKWKFLDLQPKANQKLKDSYGNEGNNLAALPTGEQTFERVKFKIGPGLIQLSGNAIAADRPDKAEGIRVNRKVRRLHFLHATHWGAPDGTVVGYYTVHYADNSEEKVEIAYGRDISDWWYADDNTAPKDAKVAWKGDNDDARKQGRKVRLYMTTWKNPHPRRRVTGVDFVATNRAQAAPFCVAITAEE